MKTAEKFKVGDKVRFVNNDGPSYFADYVVGLEGTVREVENNTYTILPQGKTFMQYGHDQNLEAVKTPSSTMIEKSEPAQAMRFNSGKPQLSYLLSFDGGIETAFDEEGDFTEALVALSEWYRGENDDLDRVCVLFFEALGNLDLMWTRYMAKVCMFGAQKYARGNYLKGRSWSDTCDSLLRHIVQHEDDCEENDEDSKLPHLGHIAWNVMFLLHCVRTFPNFDDRLRAPE